MAWWGWVLTGLGVAWAVIVTASIIKIEMLTERILQNQARIYGLLNDTRYDVLDAGDAARQSSRGWP